MRGEIEIIWRKGICIFQRWDMNRRCFIISCRIWMQWKGARLKGGESVGWVAWRTVQKSSSGKKQLRFSQYLRLSLSSWVVFCVFNRLFAVCCPFVCVLWVSMLYFGCVSACACVVRVYSYNSGVWVRMRELWVYMLVFQVCECMYSVLMCLHVGVWAFARVLLVLILVFRACDYGWPYSVFWVKINVFWCFWVWMPLLRVWMVLS